MFLDFFQGSKFITVLLSRNSDKAILQITQQISSIKSSARLTLFTDTFVNKVLLSGRKPPEDFLLPRLFFLKRKAVIERRLNINQMNSKERNENSKSKSSLSLLKLKNIDAIYFSYLCKKSNKRTHSAEGF